MSRNTSSECRTPVLSTDSQRDEFPRIVVARDRTSGAAEWDRFAASCGASFRAAWRAASAWQFDHHPAHRLRRYAIWLHEGGECVRIGQAAIGFGPGLRVFADGLQLLSEYAAHWSQAMGALLAEAGPGLYRYGSSWSLEPARDAHCASIAGVTLVDVRPISLYAVDFSRWPSWDAYLREISSNARRNAKKAEKLQDKISIGIRYGVPMLSDATHLLRLRRALYARKQVPFSTLSNALRLLLRAAVLRRNAFIAVARLDRTPVSAFGGVTFGENTYFLDAGSVREDYGVYWYLMLRMLEEAFRRAPRGRFVTGAYYQNSPVSAGLNFFRYQCRAEGNATSEFTFAYRQT